MEASPVNSENSLEEGYSQITRLFSCNKYKKRQQAACIRIYANKFDERVLQALIRFFDVNLFK